MNMLRSPRAKALANEVLWRALGRRTYARVGRFLWMQSRLDVGNDMRTNGEQRLQEAFAVQMARRRDDFVVFDVGANVGTWSVGLFHALNKARISSSRLQLHAFEPAPGALDVLRERLAAAKNLGALHVVPNAVSRESGTAAFAILSAHAGTNSLAPKESDPVQRAIEVQRITLDEYASKNGIDHITFMKVDTEGNDAWVLQGARGLLERGAIELAQFEYNDRWIQFRSYLKDVFDLVLPFGYHVGKVTPRGIETYDRWHPELERFCEGNYLLWKKELPEDLPRVTWWFY